MKIGLEAKRAFVNASGLGSYARNLITGLEQYTTHDLYLFTPSFKRSLFSPSAKIIKGKSGTLWRSFFQTQDIRKSGVEVYHGLSHELPFGIHKLSIKKIVTIHDLIFMRYPQQFSFIDRFIFKQKILYACKYADKIIALCEQTKNDLIDFLKVPLDKIVIHHQPIDSTYFIKHSQPEITSLLLSYQIKKPYWLSVGTLNTRKNAKTLIEAYAKSQSMRDLDLVLIGAGGAYRHECIKLAQLLKIEKKVHFLSNVTNEKLPFFYQGSFAFVLPSLFEGWGLPVVEAQASGKATIVSDNSSFPESAGSHSLFVDPMNRWDLQERMDELYHNSAIRIKIEQKSLEYAKMFHLQVTSKKLESIYQKTML
ncbi:MAG: glycosyltransferase family 4 protein [Bacteriovoracaceae bacterium]|nr:glycosyltransferase family 4 protein [Bacteriovoracaceae bacterium]